MSYTNLYVETHYSMNGSNITIEALIEMAKSKGFGSLAIADKRLYGAIKFYKACKKEGINPVIGLQIHFEGTEESSKNKAIVFAKTNVGYQNLLKISSLSALHDSVSIQTLKKYQRDIILIVDTNQSEFLQLYMTQNLNAFNELYQQLQSFELYFLQTDQEELNQRLDQLGKLVFSNQVLYLTEDDKDVSKVLSLIFQGNQEEFLGTKEDMVYRSLDFYQSKFKQFPEAIKRTEHIFDAVSIDISFDQLLLPEYTLKQKTTSKAYLRALAFKGLEKRLKEHRVDVSVYRKRLEYELGVIDKMGYNDYFLIVWDFVKYAKQKGYLIGPGRGSAAASLVSYCLGITSVDSIKYDLVFERFLNPQRLTMPDIDMDIPDDKRDEIIQYVRDFYGVERVASICTFGTFLMKSALRDTARVTGVHAVLLDQIISESDLYSSIEQMMKESDVVKRIMSNDHTAKDMLRVASKIEGLQKHVSTHAAGIIVTKGDMTEHTAVQPGLLDMMQTQYEAKDLEELGLLKIDFLGLRNLTSIKQIVDLINEQEQKNIDIYKIPMDDQATFDLLKRVETTGIFQLESPGMRSLIGQMQIDSFEDIVTILALFRPGPMENIPTYIKRRFEKESVSYLHPILKDILEPTNGIIIYQEQIIKIANEFAGYSFGEADVLRRAVSKKQESVLQKERLNFVNKATKQGHDEQTSNDIYDYIVKFANYGFNRAHSVAYGMVSYWMAYLKANYPKYFIGVLTSSVIGSESQMKNYIFEANKLGVRVLPPSINHSGRRFLPEQDSLRYPLLGIKNVGISTVNTILEERQQGEFQSFIDFVVRCKRSVNKRATEYLIWAGAFDMFGVTKRTLAEQYDDIINFAEYGNFIETKDFVLKEQPEYSYLELEEKEKLALGFNLMMNPILEHRNYIEKHGLYTPSTVTDSKVTKGLRVVGVVSHIRKIKTKKQQDMAFVSISDEYVKIDCVLFPRVFSTFRTILEVGNVYLFMVDLEERNNTSQLIIHKVHKLS